MRYKLRKQKVFSLICLFHGLLVYENGCRLSAMQTDFLYFCKFVIRLMLFFAENGIQTAWLVRIFTKIATHCKRIKFWIKKAWIWYRFITRRSGIFATWV